MQPSHCSSMFFFAQSQCQGIRYAHLHNAPHYVQSYDCIIIRCGKKKTQILSLCSGIGTWKSASVSPIANQVDICTCCSRVLVRIHDWQINRKLSTAAQASVFVHNYHFFPILSSSLLFFIFCVQRLLSAYFCLSFVKAQLTRVRTECVSKLCLIKCVWIGEKCVTS